MSASALVIGSRGFVGRRLVAVLQQSGVAVHGLSRSSKPVDAVPTVHTEQLASIRQDFDCVYLLAAVIPYGAMNHVTAELIEANVSLPMRVVTRFPASRLVYASSVAVYGTPLHLPVDEEHPFHHPSGYGLSKALAEQIVAAHENAAILRFSSLYGRGMTAATFLPRLVERGRREGRLVLYGNGARRQDYVHVDDAVRMLIAAGQSDRTGIFNAVQGDSHSNLEVARLVADRLGGIPIEFEGEDTSPSFVFSRAKWDDAFACRPEIPLADGVASLLDDE